MIPTPALDPVTLSDIANRCRNVRWRGDDRFTCSCPVHGGTDGDRHPSLDVKQGERCIVLTCRVGCSFEDLVKAWDLDPCQFFPRDIPWSPPRPRPDPDRRAREWFEKLRNLHAPPPPDRYRKELAWTGRLLVSGTRAPVQWATFNPDTFQAFNLRLIWQAAQELVRQGTPRHWFSPLAIAREIDRAAGRPGRAREMGIFRLCRLAVRIFRKLEKETRP